MKLKKGVAKYKFPAHSQILDVRIEANQKHNQMIAYMVQIVPGGQLDPGGSSELALPRQCAVYPDMIEFWPSPDKPYTVRVRYTPPVMEF